MKISKIWNQKINFAVLMWLFSRLIICISMLIIAPLFPPTIQGVKADFSWDVFAAWDSNHYLAIATNGYEYANDGNIHTVAFFPLFPLLIHLLINVGFSPNIAAIFINNFSFLSGLILFFNYCQKEYDLIIAKWAIIFLAFCPLSVYGSVIYNEGIFLSLSMITLIFWSRYNYFQATITGILLTATRLNALAIIPTLLTISWQEKRKNIAYIWALVNGLGLLAYMGYCWLKFGNPFVFLLVQKAWHEPGQEVWGKTWFNLIVKLLFGWHNWQAGYIVDWAYPLVFFITCGGIFCSWIYRDKLGEKLSPYLIFTSIIILWILGGDFFFDTSLILGSCYLLWHDRKMIKLPFLSYGIFSLLLIFATGRTRSIGRYAYGCISLAIIWGIFLARHPRLNYLIIFWWSMMLINNSIRFARDLWVA